MNDSQNARPVSRQSAGGHARGWRAGRRLTVAFAAGVVAAAVTLILGSAFYAPAVGWDAMAIVYCGWTWRVAWPLTPDETAARATAEDPSRASSDLLTLSASVASLGAVGIVLVSAHSQAGSAQLLLAAFGLASVAVSWFTVHTIFMLRYALLYYTEPEGGVSFNQDERPSYQDFAYLAFTIGMTFQVSDTNLKSTVVRATALRHALLSYLFGAVILAAAINLVAGLGSGGGGSG